MNQLEKRITLFLIVSLLAFSPSVLAQADLFEGQPTFSQGAELGYYVWREGDKGKVRWTTMGPQDPPSEYPRRSLLIEPGTPSTLFTSRVPLVALTVFGPGTDNARQFERAYETHDDRQFAQHGPAPD